jgi:rubrerythrin
MVAQIVEVIVCVYRAMYGWKAQVLVWDAEDKMHYPEETSYFQYPKPEEAFYDAHQLAEAYGVKFVPEARGYFSTAYNSEERRYMDGWYRCPDVKCNHAFPAPEKPDTCPQCGYTNPSS